MYPQGNTPEFWQPQYDQQPYPQAPYPQQPPPQYQVAPYQQYPGPVYGRPRRNRTPLVIVGAVLGIFVLLCALGVLLVQFGPTEDRDTGSDRAAPASSAAASASTPPAPTAADSPTEESIEGDLARFKVGDCLTITGAQNTVNPAKCTDSGAYKVLLRRDGTTDEKVCDSTDATEILYQDGTGTSRDVVLCVTPAK